MPANATPFIQKFNTSRVNNAVGSTFVGEEDRIWWDPVRNGLYYSDGVTPGGILISGGGGGGTGFNNIDGGSAHSRYLVTENIAGGAADSVYTPAQILNGGTAAIA